MRNSKRRYVNWYQIRWRKDQRRHQEDESLQTMKIASWNVNGLQCYVKKQTVTDTLETQDLSIIGLVETRIGENNHEDLSMFNRYRTIKVERGYGEKAGGGILLLVKDGIRHSAWNPLYPETPGTEKEKAWILLHSGEIQITIGFV